MKIPRVFHRIWLGGQPLPNEYRAFEDSWKRTHPAWEFKMWSEGNMPCIRNWAEFTKARALSAKANILRYELLMQYGGVYIDTDFEALRPIDDLIENCEAFVARQNGKVVNNAIIGAIPGHPFLLDLVNNLRHNIASLPEDVSSIHHSGPYYMTAQLRTHPDVVVFPSKLFYPYDWCERWRRHEAFPEAYAVHHWTLSNRASELPVPRVLDADQQSCCDVLVTDLSEDHGLRLEWVLEGLCAQTVSNFVVTLLGLEPPVNTRPLVAYFRDRLDIRLLSRHDWLLHPARLSNLVDLALEASASERAILLSANSVPDEAFIEGHAMLKSEPKLGVSLARLYASSKLYNYRPPLDRPGLIRNSAHAKPRDIGRGAAISLPTALAKQIFETGATGATRLDRILEQCCLGNVAINVLGKGSFVTTLETSGPHNEG